MNALRMKTRLAACARKTAFALAMGSAVMAAPAMASTFKLQSNTVILEERDGRTAFNVTNTGKEPILLVSKVEDLAGESMAGNVLVTPAVTRIDPGQSQMVNFSLKKGVKLDREYMLRASFEGVTQKAEHGMRMPIRQQIGFILQPKSVAAEPRPWQDLSLKVEGNDIVVSNPGKHVIRMGPTLTVQPSGATGSLPRPYVMPGESLRVSFENLGAAQNVGIVPLSRYGFAMEADVLPIGQP